MSSVFQPQQTVLGDDAYPTVPEKAAAYTFFIAQNQPFIDGNKCTALLAMTVFLEINSYELVDDDDAIAQMFEDLGNGVVGQGEFFEWVSSHARALNATGLRQLEPRDIQPRRNPPHTRTFVRIDRRTAQPYSAPSLLAQTT